MGFARKLRRSGLGMDALIVGFARKEALLCLCMDALIIANPPQRLIASAFDRRKQAVLCLLMCGRKAKP